MRIWVQISMPKLGVVRLLQPQDWWRGDRRSWRPLTSQPILTSELQVPRESLLQNKQIRQNNKEKRGGEWESKMLNTDLWPLTSHWTSGEHICIYVLTHTAPASAHIHTHIQSPPLHICAHTYSPRICTYVHTMKTPTSAHTRTHIHPPHLYICTHTYGFPTLNFTFVFFKKIFIYFTILFTCFYVYKLKHCAVPSEARRE